MEVLLDQLRYAVPRLRQIEKKFKQQEMKKQETSVIDLYASQETLQWPSSHIDFAEDNKDTVFDLIFYHAIGPGSKTYVEIGVGQGPTEHNTRFLRTMRGWKGLLVDPTVDVPRLGAVGRAVGAGDAVGVLDCYLGWAIGDGKVKEVSSTEDSLECASATSRKELIEKTEKAAPKSPIEIDLLSIDVDGEDYHILRSLLLSGKYRPRVLIIEHGHGFYWPSLQFPLNLALAPRERTVSSKPSTSRKSSISSSSPSLSSSDSESESPRRRAVETGFSKIYPATAKALVRLANAFGYELVYYGDVDLIFVRADVPGLSRLQPEIKRGAETPKAEEVQNDLLSLCLRYRASEKAFRRDTRYVTSGYCEEEKIVGLSDEEVEEHYLDLDGISDSQLRDPGFRI